MRKSKMKKYLKHAKESMERVIAVSEDPYHPYHLEACRVLLGMFGPRLAEMERRFKARKIKDATK